MAEDTQIAGLPVPPKEKVMRWVSHAGVIALGVAAVTVFMPYINHALQLILDGVFTTLQIGLTVAAVAAGTVFVMAAWPVYKKLIESLANKATWALFEYDPVTPMRMWLKEVHDNRTNLEEQYSLVQQTLAQQQMAVQDALKQAAEGDREFAAAVRMTHDENSPEARLASIKPGAMRASAERIKSIAEPLIAIQDTLLQVVNAVKFTETQAQYDVANYEREYSTAKSVTGVVGSAQAALGSKSQRKANAMQAMQIIHDKYAGSFGRLKALQDLSHDVISSVNLQEGTYHQDALDRLKHESLLITGVAVSSNVLPAEPPKAVPFYNTGKK